jgi:hypothetical protein
MTKRSKANLLKAVKLARSAIRDLRKAVILLRAHRFDIDMHTHDELMDAAGWLCELGMAMQGPLMDLSDESAETPVAAE